MGLPLSVHALLALQTLYECILGLRKEGQGGNIWAIWAIWHLLDGERSNLLQTDECPSAPPNSYNHTTPTQPPFSSPGPLPHLHKPTTQTNHICAWVSEHAPTLRPPCISFWLMDGPFLHLFAKSGAEHVAGLDQKNISFIPFCLQTGNNCLWLFGIGNPDIPRTGNRNMEILKCVTNEKQKRLRMNLMPIRRLGLINGVIWGFVGQWNAKLGENVVSPIALTNEGPVIGVFNNTIPCGADRTKSGRMSYRGVYRHNIVCYCVSSWHRVA